MGGIGEIGITSRGYALATAVFGVTLSDIIVVYVFGPKCPKNVLRGSGVMKIFKL